MHKDAWHVYISNLVPNKERSSLLRAFVNTAVSLPDIKRLHHDAVLHEITMILAPTSTVNFIALQEVSEELNSHLEVAAEKRHWAVLNGGRRSLAGKCHSLCVLIVKKSWATHLTPLDPVIIRENKKERAYPLALVENLIICSVHVPHTQDWDSTNNEKVELLQLLHLFLRS
jgi:hypothetical protein